MNHDAGGYVYLLTNKTKSVIYTGATVNLVGRTQQHRERFYKRSFSARYNVNKLVYYELHQTRYEAFTRERFIKGKSREFKENLINEFNPEWIDLYYRVLELELY